MRYQFPILAMAALCAGPACPQSQTGAAPKPQETSEHWESRTAIDCGATHVELRTFCEDKEEDLPYCPVQQATFSSPGHSRTVRNAYQFNEGAQQFIVGIACYKDARGQVVVMSKTNFANCTICEWSDLYTADGAYLGSTEGLYGNESMRHRRLSASDAARYGNCCGVRRRWSRRPNSFPGPNRASGQSNRLLPPLSKESQLELSPLGADESAEAPPPSKLPPAPGQLSKPASAEAAALSLDGIAVREGL